MKKITFVWSNTTFIGNIVEQNSSSVLGLKTVIKTIQPIEQEFTIYGKCQIGNCGPFRVLNIQN